MSSTLSRRAFLKTASSFGTAAAATCLIPHSVFAQTDAKAKPNIIIMLIDDLGWADPVCYGSRFYETPNIDRLATQGIRFTQAYAACAVCSPTRASIMTGRYPARLGLTDWMRRVPQRPNQSPITQNPTGFEGGPDKPILCPENAYWMELDEITLAETLKQAGYTTGHVGKWHLGPEAWYPEKQGFEVNIGGCDIGHPPSYFDPFADDDNNRIVTLPSRKPGEYLTDRLTGEAAQFIRGNATHPFFLYFAHYAVHTPIQAKQDGIDHFNAKTADTGQRNPVYAAMFASVDESVGRIMALLDELGIANNTLFLFTSDNGGLLGKTDNTPLRAGKGYPYEGGIRVPAILRWPGVISPGQTCDAPISSIDYFPTCCAAAGASLPADRPIDGKDIAPLLTGSGAIDRNTLFWHYPHYRSETVGPYSIVREGNWKLIHWYEPDHPAELYDLEHDPYETRDLAAKQPEKAAQLHATLDAWLKTTQARIPKPNPDYRPKT